jgi:hypothetical protein
MPQIRCTAVRFFSSEDEAAFFAWAARIPGVARVFGEGRSVILVLRSQRPSEAALRELLALFHRYKVPMQELAGYENASNTGWFRDPRAFWHKKVFP